MLVASASVDTLSQDVTANVVRALVLYSLAEAQSGTANTIRVVASGGEFSVADDGRGHAIARSVAGLPYLAFVYTHLDYPFALPSEAPIQLHTIGLSFINTLCGRLDVRVRTQDRYLQRSYRDGAFIGEQSLPAESQATGNVISGEVSPRFQQIPLYLPRLEAWLRSVAAAHSSVQIFLNEQRISAAK